MNEEVLRWKHLLIKVTVMKGTHAEDKCTKCRNSGGKSWEQGNIGGRRDWFPTQADTGHRTEDTH